MLSRTIASFFAASLVIAIPCAAKAFCRTTTTSMATADPLNCSVGKGIYWSKACVGYRIDEQASRWVPLSTAENLMEQHTAAWLNGNCPAGGHPSIQLIYLGPNPSPEIGYFVGKDNANDVLFHDDAWPHNDSAHSLALTTLTYSVSTGEILDTDIEFNMTRSELNNPTPGQVNLDTAFMHELGHFFGLDHSNASTSIMTPYGDVAATIQADDIAGICSIYPSDGSRNTADGPIQASPCSKSSSLDSACAAPPPSHGCSVSPVRTGASVGSGIVLLGALVRVLRRIRNRT